MALLILVLLLALVEMAARTDFIGAHLPAPSIGGSIKPLGIKLAYLDELVEKKGHVDCIFLGASMILLGIDPETFSQAYRSRTGQEIVGFNFGIGGFIPPAAGIMARILIEKYQPKLLLWGLSPTSFSDKIVRTPEKLLMEIPWVRYRLGAFNLEGWLADHSYAYRYFLRFRIWLEQPGYSKELSDLEPYISRYGRKITKSKKLTPLPANPKKEIHARSKLKDFKMSKKAIAALREVIKLRSQVQIVIFEIPVHRNILSFYGRGPDDHYRILSFIRKQARRGGILFIPTMHLDLIPDEGWSNLNHLNNYGSRIFSSWLGEQMAQVVKKGLIKGAGLK